MLLLLVLLLIASTSNLCQGFWWLPIYVNAPAPADPLVRLLEYKRANEKPDGEQKAYRRINDALATIEVSEGDFKLNWLLDKVRELYNTERNKLVRSRQLIEALEYLFKLIRLEENDDCDERALEILEHNDHGTESRASEFWVPKKKHWRPIDAIVHNYFVQHAERCKQVYIDRFKRIQQPLGLEQLEGFLMELINERLVLSFNNGLSFSNKSEHKFKLDTLIGELTNVEPFSMNSGGLMLLGLSGLLIRNNDTENKNHLDNLLEHRDGFDKTGFKQLVSEYLVEPCQVYVKIYGPQVFEMVLFDYKVMKKTYVSMDQSLLGFYYAWAYYKLCKQVSLAGVDQTFDMLLEFWQRKFPK